MEVDADARAYEALSQHPRLPDLAALARASMTGAAETRKSERQPERVSEMAKEMKLSRDEAGTPFGNALDVLERGPEDAAERALACALAAHVVALHPPKERDDEDRLANDLLWLAAHTSFDATGLLDRALGDRAANLWDALADRIRRIDEGKLPALGRGEALVAAVALTSSRSKGAMKQASALAAEVRDRKLGRVLAAGAEREPVDPVVGEMAPAPRGPVMTGVLAVTGILLVVQGARLLGRVALAYKKPAELTLSDDGGVRVHWRVELLGRTLREREMVVPRTALLRATREVRYPRLALYAGLLALAVGSYVGVSAFVDGVRAASPSLLASGLGVVALGLALDFALSSVAPGAKGRCRLLLVPRDGAKLCIAGVDPRRADAVLARLSRA
ncbi:MAG TPA: hypothetical protein VHS09_11675 [Polyangiaceae bacterium]|jgi:hypothetical protein|nr:hypothetical protein [Polyangiaceae bacterium]